MNKTETDSQTKKTNFWLPKEKGEGGGVNQEFGMNIYTALYITIRPTVQHRKEKNRIYNLFVSYIKLTLKIHSNIHQVQKYTV